MNEQPPEGHIYVSCEVCGEKALLPHDAPTINRAGRRVTVAELLETETLGSCGPWRCPRHPLRNYTNLRFA